jgi:hypothetical protein
MSLTGLPGTLVTVPPRDVLEWLLQPDNPPVRYLTLTNLLHKPPESAEVRKAKARLMDYPVTQEILRHTEEFPSDVKDRAYTKYSGPYWQLIFLGQFLADGKDPRIAGWAQDILEKRAWVTRAGCQCLTANMLAAYMRLGYGNHPVVVQETEALAERTLGDGGIRCAAMDYSLLPHCHMAQPKLLLCFSLIPPGKRSPAVNSTIRLLLTNLLDTELFVYVPGHQREWQEVLMNPPKRSELGKGETIKGWVAGERERFLKSRGFGDRRPKQGWLKFGFPLHYNSDIMEAMYSLVLLGVPLSPRLKKPLEVIRQKMTRQGKWILENSLNGKMLADVEEKGKPSKWLTYYGHHVLMHFGATQ